MRCVSLLLCLLVSTVSASAPSGTDPRHFDCGNSQAVHNGSVATNAGTANGQPPKKRVREQYDDESEREEESVAEPSAKSRKLDPTQLVSCRVFSSFESVAVFDRNDLRLGAEYEFDVWLPTGLLRKGYLPRVKISYECQFGDELWNVSDEAIVYQKEFVRKKDVMFSTAVENKLSLISNFRIDTKSPFTQIRLGSGLSLPLSDLYFDEFGTGVLILAQSQIPESLESFTVETLTGDLLATTWMFVALGKVLVPFKVPWHRNPRVTLSIELFVLPLRNDEVELIPMARAFLNSRVTRNWKLRRMEVRRDELNADDVVSHFGAIVDNWFPFEFAEVSFVGENGVDGGGLKQEMFALALSALSLRLTESGVLKAGLSPAEVRSLLVTVVLCVNSELSSAAFWCPVSDVVLKRDYLLFAVLEPSIRQSDARTQLQWLTALERSALIPAWTKRAAENVLSDSKVTEETSASLEAIGVGTDESRAKVMDGLWQFVCEVSLQNAPAVFRQLFTDCFLLDVFQAYGFRFEETVHRLWKQHAFDSALLKRVVSSDDTWHGSAPRSEVRAVFTQWADARSDADLRALWRFWTAKPQITAQMLEALKAVVYVQADDGANRRRPHAHTCANQLVLFDSLTLENVDEIMQDALSQMHFGFC